MTVIRLVLRDENHVGVRYVGEVLYAGRTGMFGEEKFGVPHGRGTGDPWVDKD